MLLAESLQCSRMLVRLAKDLDQGGIHLKNTADIAQAGQLQDLICQKVTRLLLLDHVSMASDDLLSGSFHVGCDIAVHEEEVACVDFRDLALVGLDME